MANIEFDIDNLRERCDEVNPIEAIPTVKSLAQKLNKYKDLYALTAPQLGIKQRVICIKYSNGVIKEYINPRILKSEGYHLVREKDISIPDKEYISPRPNKILVEYQLQTAKPERNILKDTVAEVFDREMNYLDGIPLCDYGLEVLEGFDNLSEEEKQQIIDMYIKSLKTREEELNKEIEEDKDAKELKNAIDFMEGVDAGKINLMPVEEIK